MRNIVLYLLLALISAGIISCEEESSPLFEQESFTKIYDNGFFNAAYQSLDLVQTADGGYLILASKRLEESTFSGIYIMKANKSGEFEKGIDMEPGQGVNATNEMLESGGAYYFFCMGEQSLNAQLAKVDEDLSGDSVQMISLAGKSYPAAAGLADDNNFILLNYNHEEKSSDLSKVDVTGAVTAIASVDIGAGDDVDEPLINHFFQTGRKFPFLAGQTSGGTYYFNGFANYTFSLLFLNANGDIVANIEGQHDDGGFSAVEPIAGNKFAASRFNYGDNYFMPQLELTMSGVASSTDLGGNILPELVPDARVRILRTVIQEKNIIIYATDTRSKQIGLLFYDEATGEFFGTHYLGFSNPFELGGIIQTSDEGLAVCGTTYLAGRFPRMCLFKLSKEELAANIN